MSVTDNEVIDPTIVPTRPLLIQYHPVSHFLHQHGLGRPGTLTPRYKASLLHLFHTCNERLSVPRRTSSFLTTHRLTVGILQRLPALQTLHLVPLRCLA